MKKNNIRFAILAAIFLAVYHLVIFILPFVHNSMFWLSYGFTWVAFAVAIVACIIAFRSTTDIDSKFFGYPIAKVGVCYLMIQLVASLIFMALSPYIPAIVGVTGYSVLFFGAISGLIVKDTVRDHIRNQDLNLREDVMVMRTAQSKLNQMASQCPDREVAIVIKKLSEEVRFSDPVSSPELVEIEKELTVSIDDLQQALVDGDFASVNTLCNRTNQILLERNRICKLKKKQKSASI